MRVSLKDVAREAGVSISLVSRTYTRGASLAPGTRAKITKASKNFGYWPNVLARSLITQESKIIALAVSYLENQFYPAVITTLLPELMNRRYHALLFTEDEVNSAERVVNQIMAYPIASVLVASVGVSSEIAVECGKARIRVVVINQRANDQAGSCSATGDSVRGGWEIGEFLFASGHERIGYLAGKENPLTSNEREEGLLAALAAGRRDLHSKGRGDYVFERATEETRKLLSRKTALDAIFCANDHMAIAAMEGAKFEFGIQIPKDLSIVGSDDVGPSKWRSLALTTFEQPVNEMCELALELLFERIDDAVKTGEDLQSSHVNTQGALSVCNSARVPASGSEMIDGR